MHQEVAADRTMQRIGQLAGTNTPAGCGCGIPKPCPNPTLLYQDLHNCRAKPAVVPNSQHVEQPSGRAELPSKPGKRTTMREWEPSPEPDKRARLT
ncbi:hypothetical protein HaLaN_24583 [Haematococcus lacustris]|uniref:Uncharacterized protein n=1 Tax=Haematococcus lacustris TaxID=44745 RepID=A0A6A0A2M4_HAELA|nr:hypothetical protein HaLaN_24583 [Haematococcus lacustris]